MTKAWMLRSDNTAFPVKVHIYAMGDSDLSSEAEAASFIISTKSKDTELAETVLAAWMTLLIENVVEFDADKESILATLEDELNSLPYTFPYPLSTSEYIKIFKKYCDFSNVDDLYSYVDSVRDTADELQSNIKQSLNQQFCRVRYGGQYDSRAGNSSIWFRISSVGFNWANNIYLFVSEHKRSLKLTDITICRDHESDNGDNFNVPEYFYKAKDGAVYYLMPIDEFLNEEHEHSLVFSTTGLNSGIITTIRSKLASGSTLFEIKSAFNTASIAAPPYIVDSLLKEEKAKCMSSEFLDNAPTVTRTKFAKVFKIILNDFPEIETIDVEARPRPNRNGKMVGVEYIFTIESSEKAVDGLQVGVAFSRDDANPDIIARGFRREYSDYKSFNNLKF